MRCLFAISADIGAASAIMVLCGSTISTAIELGTIMELLSRFQGCIVGLAIGDALGRPAEFLHTLAAIYARFGTEGVTDLEPDGHPAGTFTDDTQMSLCVARALVRAGHAPLDTLMSDMAKEFVEWSRSAENDRAPGTTCMAGCRNLGRGIGWQEAGIVGSKGCGSAMRTAPIGLLYHDNERKLIAVARASSLPTHGHPTALASAATTALLTAWAVRRETPAEYPKRLACVMRQMNGGEQVAALVEKVPDLLQRRPEEVLCSGALGEAWTGDEAVASALYCFYRSPEDYRETVLTGANTVGDSDSIACIAGAISGAYNGLDAIPKKWRAEVENASYLLQISAELMKASSLPTK
jgi:ADP-ribosylglycohydrolase